MGCYGSTDGANGNSSTRNRGGPGNTRGRGNANYLPNPRIEKVLENKYVGKGVK